MVSEEQKKSSPLLFLVIGIIIGLCCCMVGFYIGGKINDKEEPKTEEKEPKEIPIEEDDKKEEEPPKDNKEEPKKLTNEELEKLVNPFLDLLYRNCSSKESFYITKDTNFDNMKDEDKYEIAYLVANQIKDIELENFDAKLLEKGYKLAFGNDKEITLPEQLDIESMYANYSLKDGEYVLEANGGGCIIYGDFLQHKIVDSTYENDELNIIVNFVYVVRDNNLGNQSDYSNVDDEKVTSKIYNNHSKKRLIESNVPFKTEDKKINEVLSSDKTDHIQFTFVKEKDSYIFKKAELVER